MESEGSPWEDDAHIFNPHTEKTSLEYLVIATYYFFGVVPILMDIILIVVILKYKRLKNRNNMYLLNFATSHMCYIVSTPVFYIILDMFYNGELEVRWYCVWIRVEYFAMALVFSFCGGFGIDAFLESVKPKWFSNYADRYPYVFSFIYFAFLLKYLAAASVCLKKGLVSNFNLYLLTTYYFLVLLLLMLILYLTHKQHSLEKSLKISTRNKSYAVKVAFIIHICWLPLLIFDILMVIYKNNHDVERVLSYIALLPEYLAYYCSIIAVYKLWKSNKYFKLAFLKVFRRPVSNSDYNELNTREDEPGVSEPL